jgi:hypothetical protein
MRNEYKNPKAKVISPKTKKGMTRMLKAPEGIEYYDLEKNWEKVKPHLGDSELKKILARDMNKFTYGTWRQKFSHGDLPCDFDERAWVDDDEYEIRIDE